MKDDEEELEKVMEKKYLDRAYEEYEQNILDRNEREERIKRMRKMKEFLENNNPFEVEKKLERRKEKNTINMFGIKIDKDELEEKSGNLKQYSIEDYKRDLDYIIKKYGKKLKQTINFFKKNPQVKLKISKKISQRQKSLLEMHSLKEKKGFYSVSDKKLLSRN